MGSNDERENTLNQILVEMDGFGTQVGSNKILINSNVIMIRCLFQSL
jgi:ATP-dependent Zn protease